MITWVKAERPSSVKCSAPGTHLDRAKGQWEMWREIKAIANKHPEQVEPQATICPALRKACNRIRPDGDPFLVKVEPHALSIPQMCYANTETCIRAFGGRLVLGWKIFEDRKDYRFEHHGIWMRPDGVFISPSPEIMDDETITFLQQIEIEDLHELDIEAKFSKYIQHYVIPKLTPKDKAQLRKKKAKA